MDAVRAIIELKSYAEHSWGSLNGAFESAISALEKQIPIKPIYSGYDDDGYGKFIPMEAKCPICGYEFEFGTWNDEESHHCVCGQKMKWSE